MSLQDLTLIFLERILTTLPIDARGDGVAWFASLFGDRHGEFQINLNDPQFTPEHLLRLTRLAYQHVRPSDDTVHVGSYSPDFRDRAEQGRNSVLSTLLSARGMDAWNAKLSIIDNPLFSHFKDRVAALACESAAEEADDAIAVSEVDLLALDKAGELPPMNRDDMFALLVDRLDDLDELLVEDDSPRAAWAAITEEKVMRQVISRELRHAARSAYTVDQEAATADEKETDIRLRSTRSDQQAIIELKLGEKDRSGKELRDVITEQLVTKYMEPRNSRSGCLLITIAGNKKGGWNHPDTGKKLDFVGLIAMLSDEATRIQSAMGGEIRLIVKGLDLRPRLATERAKSKK